MKKLVLKNLDLNPEDMLNRDHLKTIFGGYGGYDQGPWACGCYQNNVSGVPECNQTNCDWACTNQGGWTGGCIAVG